MTLLKAAALLTAVLLSVGAGAQTPVARFIYEDAEAAFAQGDHALTLTRLREAEQAFGKMNPPILYLRILARHGALKAQGEAAVDFDLLDPLRADIRRYLKDYGAMEVLVDQAREVYQLSRELERYPADRAAYESKIAAERRAVEAAAEQARQAAAARIDAERQRMSEPFYSFRDCPTCPEMVVIPGGKLTVQSASGPREIDIQPFALSRWELTWEQWAALTGHDPARFPKFYKNCPRCPVNMLLYNPHLPLEATPERDLNLALVGLHKATGWSYHAPSEAQWEWACRGGEQHLYCGGDTLEVIGHKAGLRGADAFVGSKMPNQYGLFDMTGNAVELTADSWSPVYDPPADGGPRYSEAPGTRVVVRGASARSPLKELAMTHRAHGTGGVRVARPLLTSDQSMSYTSVPSPANGAVITALDAGGVAEQAGLRVGDVVVTADGRPILGQNSLFYYLAQRGAERTVQLEFLRGGALQSVAITFPPKSPQVPK